MEQTSSDFMSAVIKYFLYVHAYAHLHEFIYVQYFSEQIKPVFYKKRNFLYIFLSFNIKLNLSFLFAFIKNVKWFIPHNTVILK